MTMMVTMVLLVVAVGLLMAATPWLMPPTECFAVTVPPSAQHDERIRGYKRAFALAVAGVTVACGVVFALVGRGVLGVAQPSEEQVSLLVWAIVGATFLPILVGMGLMLHYRGLVSQLKAAEGWTVDTPRSAAVVGEDVPRPLPLAWNLLYVPLVLGMVVFGLRSYDSFPAQIPMRIDAAGVVSEYAAKSMGAVLFPAVVSGYLAAMLSLCHAGILVSKRPIDPAAPASSAYAYGRFARMQSIALLAGGLVLCTVLGVSFYLSALGRVSMKTAGVWMTVAAILFAAGMIASSVALGQSGGRLAAELRDTDDLARDDDAYWPLGIFYRNAEDPSVVVPKRFGVGWTINIARPAAWLAVGLVVLCAVAISVFGVTLAG